MNKQTIQRDNDSRSGTLAISVYLLNWVPRKLIEKTHVVVDVIVPLGSSFLLTKIIHLLCSFHTTTARWEILGLDSEFVF
jgi:hypothetical protein